MGVGKSAQRLDLIDVETGFIPDGASAGADAGASGPRALGRMLRVFDLLARRRESMTLSEISAALDVPRSTLLSSLRALVADGHLMSEGSAYRLGPSVFRLAGTILSAWSMPDIVRHYLRALARDTRESVGFAIADWEIGQAIYTDGISSTQPVHYAMRPGLRAPLYASAAGRVLLAFASAERRDAYLSRAPFKRLTGRTRTSASAIRASLDLIVEQGFCASFGEMLEDTAALAVPTFDSHGQAIGALMLAAPRDRVEAKLEALQHAIIRHGRLASGLPCPPGDAEAALA